MAVTKYIYDGDTVLQETNGAGVTQATYTSTAQGYGDLLSRYDGSAAAYYEPDALGSTEALANQSQTVTDKWRYRAFGAATQTLGSPGNPFTWVGRQGYVADNETGLYLLGSGTRHYDPQTAQFLSRDPIEFAGGDANLYRYVENNPTSRIDPAGFQPILPPPRPAPPVLPPPRPVEVGPIPRPVPGREQATAKDCEDAIKTVLGSPWLQQLAMQFGFKCILPPIKCDTSEQKDTRLRGTFDPNVPEIRIYVKNHRANQLARTIVHELVHAFDDCKGFPVRTGNVAKACKELRAIYYSGVCHTVEANGGNLRPGKGVAECLLELVKPYLTPEKVGGYQFEEEAYVCCVWDFCLSGRRTPGSGVYEIPPLTVLPNKPDEICGKHRGDCETILGPSGEKLREWCGSR